ncbi:hypothetical protein LN650_23575 [Klebsiella pneumoniae subsp. pneumoniae]|nr:hypothetical protein [Klebsiella pneumoniae subsp. pneumoniae]
MIAYRFYGLYIAKTVLGVARRGRPGCGTTMASTSPQPTKKCCSVTILPHNDLPGLPGPLVGPVPRRADGLPPCRGMIWILALAWESCSWGRYRTLHMVLFGCRPAAMAVRLANWLKREMGPTAGVLALVAMLHDHGDHPRGPGDDCGESARPHGPVGT